MNYPYVLLALKNSLLSPQQKSSPQPWTLSTRVWLTLMPCTITKVSTILSIPWLVKVRICCLYWQFIGIPMLMWVMRWGWVIGWMRLGLRWRWMWLLLLSSIANSVTWRLTARPKTVNAIRRSTTIVGLGGKICRRKLIWPLSLTILVR